jgi:hypothetical protein
MEYCAGRNHLCKYRLDDNLFQMQYEKIVGGWNFVLTMKIQKHIKVTLFGCRVTLKYLSKK